MTQHQPEKQPSPQADSEGWFGEANTKSSTLIYSLDLDSLDSVNAKGKTSFAQ